VLDGCHVPHLGVGGDPAVAHRGLVAAPVDPHLVACEEDAVAHQQRGGDDVDIERHAPGAVEPALLDVDLPRVEVRVVQHELVRAAEEGEALDRHPPGIVGFEDGLGRVGLLDDGALTAEAPVANLQRIADAVLALREHNRLHLGVVGRPRVGFADALH